MDINSKLQYLSFMNIITENNKSWFINECWNAIFQMDRNNYEPVYIDFPKVYFGHGAQYKWLAKWNKRFVCISNFSNIPLYIIDDRKKHFTITLPKRNASVQYMIYNIMQRRQFLYLFTDNTYISVIEFNMETGEYIRTLNWNKSSAGRRQIPFKMGKTFCYNNSFWSSILGTDYVIEITCDTFEINLYESEKNICYERAFAIKDNCYYALGSKEDRCVIMAGILKESKKKLFDISKYVKEPNYSDLRVEKDNVWLFPKDDTNIIKICFSTGDYKELRYPSAFLWRKDRRYQSGIRFMCIENVESKWILYPRTGNGILLVDKETDIIDYIPLAVDMTEIMKLQAKKVVMKNVSRMEDGLYFLLELMNRTDESTDRNFFHQQNTIGYDIFRNL